jgi:hypothetical protein
MGPFGIGHPAAGGRPDRASLQWIYDAIIKVSDFVPTVIVSNPATKLCQILQRNCVKSCNEIVSNPEIIVKSLAYLVDNT